MKFLLNAFVLIFALKHFSCKTNSLITSLILWNQQVIRHSNSVNCYLCCYYSEPFCFGNMCFMTDCFVAPSLQALISNLKCVGLICCE